MIVTKHRQVPIQDIADILSGSMYQRLFPSHLELVPQLNEVYELELAFYESQVLSLMAPFRTQQILQ